MNLAQADAVFWQVDGASVTASPDGGRAKSGLHSMYYGVFVDQPATELFTTPLATVEAVATTDSINLGTVAPKLTFWQQISLADHRLVPPLTSRLTLDRGVVQLQLTDEPQAPWTHLYPLVNFYDSHVAENTFACAFDPIDDGNTEDDFFDPTDPWRDWGPSSTCPGELVWAHQGATAGPFNTANVGYATTPPAASDSPSLGSGTWVPAEIDLTEFRGRSARLRFLVTSIKLSTENWDQFTSNDNNGPLDDGWWIDDVRIDETLDLPAEFSNDTFDLRTCSGGQPCIEQCRLSGAPCSTANPCGVGQGDCVAPCPGGQSCAGPPPGCGANCSIAQANVFVEPPGPLNPASVTTSAPFTPVVVNAAAIAPPAGAVPSSVDACIGGFQQYRFCRSGDPDGSGPSLPDDDCDDVQDTGVSPWGPYAFSTLMPESTTTYAIEVRCQTAPDCRDGQALQIVVNCPGGSPNTLGLKQLRALTKTLLVWNGALNVDWLRGSFTTSDDVGEYVEDFFGFTVAATSVPMAGNPPAGTGYYYLVKRDGPVHSAVPGYTCGQVTWRSGGVPPEFGRDVAFGNP